MKDNIDNMYNTPNHHMKTFYNKKNCPGRIDISSTFVKFEGPQSLIVKRSSISIVPKILPPSGRVLLWGLMYSSSEDLYT